MSEGVRMGYTDGEGWDARVWKREVGRCGLGRCGEEWAQLAGDGGLLDVKGVISSCIIILYDTIYP
jgi:hypothetical protein